MKKFYKFFTILACLFLLTGCQIYVYDVGDNNNSNPSDTGGSSSNLTQSGTGSTIVTDDIDYTGNITFTDQVPSDDLQWQTVYNQVKNSVVTVRNIVAGKINATGSGVFFAQDSITNGHAYIFTNAHVVKGSSTIEVLLANGILVEGTLIGYDENEDVAVIQVEKRNDYTIATLRKSETLQIGEEILAIGSPIGEKYSETATSGIISNLNIDITPDNSSMSLYLIQIDAALNPGNSGGPLFDKAGNLIGINTMKLLSSGTTTDIESFNYAIPISHFALVAEHLLQGELYYRPFISITIIDVRYLTFAERSSYGLSVTNGLLLMEINTDSPLYNKATTGQVITHIEDVKVVKANDFSVELLKYAPDETITLTICNADGSNSQNIEITLLKRTS